jgi:hypothetical protein
LRQTADPVTHPNLKIATALIVGVLGVVALGFGWSYGWLGLMLCVGVLAWHARQGGAAAAFEAFRRGDLDSVRHSVHRTWWPRLLSRQNQAYQNWMEGVVLAADCRFAQAREKLLVAAAGAIQTENDRSLIQCLLAEVAIRQQDWNSARDHLALAKRLKHHEQVDRMIAVGEERLRVRDSGDALEREVAMPRNQPTSGVGRA